MPLNLTLDDTHRGSIRPAARPTPARSTRRAVPFVAFAVLAAVCEWTGSATAGPVTKVFHVRADSATGTGPYPVPGSAGPWMDLSGHGRNATLVNFLPNGGNGWEGDGTLASPHRLYFDGPHQRAMLPLAPIPELADSTQPVTAAVWFKTGFDGPKVGYDYLLEWVEEFSPNAEYEGQGMSIAINQSKLQVYQNGWVDAAVVAPNTWYHIVVVKSPGDLRLYVNGTRTFTNNHPHMGAMRSYLTIGSSTFRWFEGYVGEAMFWDYYSGAIAQTTVWTGAMDDVQAQEVFRADSAKYLPTAPEPGILPVLDLRASAANGSTPNPVPGHAGPWFDHAGAPNPATLHGFSGADTTSGWAGFGRPASPWRLAFDGVNDAVSIPAGTLPELAGRTSTTTQLWFKTGANVGSPTVRYLADWRSAPGAIPGLSLAAFDGFLKVLNRTPEWEDAAALSPDTWYQATVVKRPGAVDVYVNGALAFSGVSVNVGPVGTDLVLGASTQGAGLFGDHFDGALGRVRLWRGALSASAVRESWQSDSAAYFGPNAPFTVTASAGPNGSISPAGAVSVPVGDSRTFTFTPAAHFQVANVLVDGVSVGDPSSYTFTDVSGDHTIAVSFETLTFPITATTTFGGSIAPSGVVEVVEGGSQGFTVTPGPHSTLVDLAVDGASVGALSGWTFTNVLAPHTIHATFVVDSLTIVATAGANGSVTPSGNVRVPHGGEPVFSITPNTHYDVADVLVDGVSQGAVPSYTFPPVSVAHTLEASFSLSSYVLTLNASGGGGSVTKDPDQFTYAPGQPVLITALPAAGVSFLGWSGDTATTANPVTLPMIADRTVTALFADTTAPAAQLLAPNGGEGWEIGSSRSITWSASDGVGVVSVSLDYSRDEGATWTSIATGLPNTGSHAWTVPAPSTSRGRVRVTAHDAAGHSTTDGSNANFSIVAGNASRIVHLRADSASGSAPHPAPGAAGPWVDLKGDHDASLTSFNATPTSGWMGAGTLQSPHRLEFDGAENRAVIPAASVPWLQVPTNPVSAEVWLKTGLDGPVFERFDYVLEWVTSGGNGMSIAVENGKLQVYLQPWVAVATVQPDTWYHVVVSKQPGDVKVWVNGAPSFAGDTPLLGVQETPIAIGASTWRHLGGSGTFGDYWSGAIGQVSLWNGMLTDSLVLASYRADSAKYQPRPADPPLALVAAFDADSANGSGAYPVPGSAGPWVNLVAPGASATLRNFGIADTTSGWAGLGIPSSPHRLEFDGYDDAVTVDAGAIAPLQVVDPTSVEFWFRSGPDVASSTFRYLCEWLSGAGSTYGMAIGYSDGQLQVYLRNPYWMNVAPILPDTWYHAVVVKDVGGTRAYLDGVRVFDNPRTLLGTQGSEWVLGASTWRGAGIYGEHFDGAFGLVRAWRGALSDSMVNHVFQTSRGRFSTSTVSVIDHRHGLALAGLSPNPSQRALGIVFTLPDGTGATLELVDLAGRRIRAREVGSLGAGTHRVDLSEGVMPAPGMYWVRLRHQGVMLTRKAIVIR